MAHQEIADLVKAAPPLTITGMTMLGFPISDWVLLLTALYTILQIYLLLRRMVFAIRSSDRDPNCAEDCAAIRRIRQENRQHEDNENDQH